MRRVWILVVGVSAVLAGVAIIAWPKRTVYVVAWVFASALIAGGLLRLLAAFADPEGSQDREVHLVLQAIAGLGVGIYLLFNSTASLVLLMIVVSIYWFAHGLIDLTAVARTANGPNGLGCSPAGRSRWSSAWSSQAPWRSRRASTSHTSRARPAARATRLLAGPVRPASHPPRGLAGRPGAAVELMAAPDSWLPVSATSLRYGVGDASSVVGHNGAPTVIRRQAPYGHPSYH